MTTDRDRRTIDYTDHIEEMDSCLRSSSILYTRLYELSKRVHLADRRPTPRVSANNQIS